MSKLALELRTLLSYSENEQELPFSLRQQKRIMQDVDLIKENEGLLVSALEKRCSSTEIVRDFVDTQDSSSSHIEYEIGNKRVSRQLLKRALALTGINLLEYFLSGTTSFLLKAEYQEDPLLRAIRTTSSPEIKNLNTEITQITNNKGKHKVLNIELTYNPYLVTTDIKINNALLKDDDDFMTSCKNKRIQDWIDSFLVDLKEKYREREMQLTVNCTNLDAADISDAVSRFNKKHTNENVTIELTIYKHTQSVDEKINQLKKLYKKAKNGPFEEFREKRLEENFNSALSPDFEVNVIATMSSGKSTVINAMLGQDLMPSKNEACTATIARIEDCDSEENFSGRRRDNNNQLLDGDYTPIDKNILEEWNSDSNTSVIELRGDIKSIEQTEHVRLVLIDTPGPNNSRDASHRRTMLDAINRKPLSMVLYILNATQLNIDDDASLLKTVSEEMAKGGRKAQDRFIFVLNKIDMFDPEDGESVSSAIQSAKDYLRKSGIENPLVIPVSAELAKLIRIVKFAGEKALTRKQRGQLKTFVELFIEEDEMNMLNHVKADINPLCYELLSNQIDNVSNEYEHAEVLSGIPIIETLFGEFLQKHALPAKIKDAVDSFHHIMAKAERIEKLNIQLEKSEDELNDAVHALEEFEQNKERLNKAQEFRQAVKEQTYVPSNVLVDEYKNIQTRLFTLIEDRTEDFQEEVEPERARQEVDKIEKECEQFIIEIESAIQKAVDEEFIIGLNAIRDEYEGFITDLLNQEFPSLENIDLLEFQKVSMKMPNVEELLDNHTENVKVDSYEVSDSVWYNPFSWGRTKTINTYDDRVDMKETWREISAELREAVQDNIDQSNILAKQKSEEGKKIILNSMDEIDRVFKENLVNMKNAASDSKEAQRQIDENKKLLAWYKEFEDELNSVLSIQEQL